MRNLKVKNKLLAVDDLQVCGAYQRMIVKSRVSAIVKKFDADAFGSLCVGEREDGSYWIVDGLQRHTAAQALGLSQVRCDVFASSGPAHEARIFRHKNKDRTAVSAVTVFKALLQEGDQQALAIRSAVENAGLSLSLGPGRSAKAWPAVCCVGALRNIYELAGADHLTRVLNIVTEAWKGEVDATRGTILDGLSLFVHRAENVDDKRLSRKLKAIEPMAILRFADSQRGLIGGGRSSAVATAFLNFYNKGLSKKLAFGSG